MSSAPGRLVVLCCLGAAGCLQGISLDASGFRCVQDADCDEATRCVQGFCAASGLPDGGSVGVPAGTMLTPLIGDQNFAQEGEVIDGKEITGCVTISASQVTIRRSRITCNGFYVITAYATTMGTVVEDVELRGTSTDAFVGFEGANARLTRVDIHDLRRAVDLGGNVVMESSWVHDLVDDGAGAVECNGGSGVHLRNNRIDRGTSMTVGSAVRMSSDVEALSDVWVEANKLNGGPYILDVYQRSGNGTVTGLHVLNNRFGRSFVDGPLHLDAITGTIELSGNVFDDTGEAVP